MTPERWQHIKQLLQSALAREADERAAFLDEACAGDDQLRRQVESLIISHDEAGSFIEDPAFEVMAELFADNQIESLEGRSFDHYRVLARLGAGGMGEVYLAEDTKLGRKVALKLLPAECTKNEERLRRFRQEARAASALNHPNILTIYEIGQTNSRHFISTEFIEGETLRLKITKGRMTIAETLDVSIQITSALAAAHQAGILHRDIKPENLMVREDGIIKLLDFGIAKLTERKTDESEAMTLVRTKQGVVMGTVLYMSPEQARGLDVDARTDIFSLGIVLYEMVAGRLPFEGLNRNEILAAILSDKEAPPLARYTRDVPPEFERIIEKTLRKDREERYQTAKGMLLDLRRLKHKLEVDAEIERLGAPGLTGVVDDAKPSTNRDGTLTIRASSAPATTIERARPASSAEYLVSAIKQHKRGVVLILVPIILILAGIVYFFYFARTGPIDSIAVLPLNNESNDSNTEYLSDGITESIISNLSQLPQLKVMARATVFRFKGKEIDPQKVGRDLKVRAVLTGRLLQQGDNLVIRTELVNVADGTQLWGAEYNRKLSDALAVQQDISREISEKLRLRLTGEEKKRLTERDTANAEAYQFYLKGRYFWNKRTADELKKAIAQFQQAVDRDRNYALGFVGLADCYLVLEEHAGLSAGESLPKARDAADRALELNDSLAEAHASSAFIYMNLWRWAEAEKEFKRAISLNPNYPTAHHWFSIYLRVKGRLDDALEEIKRAQVLDPLSPIISNNVSDVYILKKDFNRAIAECQNAIELDPNFPLAYQGLGIAYLKQQRYEEATAAFMKEVELSKRSAESISDLGYCYAIRGKRPDALQILKEAEEKYARRESIGQYVARVYAGLGDKDQAFAWLEKDFQQRSGVLPFITWWFTFEDLRNDPRYTDLVRRMGLQP
jgi:serine/threonine-protein kinase